MSSEDSVSYSDARSDTGGHGNITVSSDSSPEPLVSRPQRKISPSSNFLRTESLFLVVLFALVAVLLPVYFSSTSRRPSAEVTEVPVAEPRTSPLVALLPYVPTIWTVLYFSYSALQILLRPFIFLTSLVLALLAPLFIVANILFKLFVLLPSRLIAGFTRYLYPVYLFCGVACLLGAVIGIGGRLFIEGSKLMLLSTHDTSPATKRSKRLVV